MAIAGAIAPIPLIYWSGETEPFFGPVNWQHAAISSIGGLLGIAWIGWYGYIGFAVSRGWFSKNALMVLPVALIFGGLSLFVLYMYLADRSSWNSGLAN